MISPGFRSDALVPRPAVHDRHVWRRSRRFDGRAVVVLGGVGLALGTSDSSTGGEGDCGDEGGGFFHRSSPSI